MKDIRLFIIRRLIIIYIIISVNCMQLQIGQYRLIEKEVNAKEYLNCLLYTLKTLKVIKHPAPNVNDGLELAHADDLNFVSSQSINDMKEILKHLADFKFSCH